MSCPPLSIEEEFFMRMVFPELMDHIEEERANDDTNQTNQDSEKETKVRWTSSPTNLIGTEKPDWGSAISIRDSNITDDCPNITNTWHSPKRAQAMKRFHRRRLLDNAPPHMRRLIYDSSVADTTYDRNVSLVDGEELPSGWMMGKVERIFNKSEQSLIQKIDHAINKELNEARRRHSEGGKKEKEESTERRKSYSYKIASLAEQIAATEAVQKYSDDVAKAEMAMSKTEDNKEEAALHPKISVEEFKKIIPSESGNIVEVVGYIGVTKPNAPIRSR